MKKVVRSLRRTVAELTGLLVHLARRPVEVPGVELCFGFVGSVRELLVGRGYRMLSPYPSTTCGEPKLNLSPSLL